MIEYQQGGRLWCTCVYIVYYSAATNIRTFEGSITASNFEGWFRPSNLGVTRFCIAHAQISWMSRISWTAAGLRGSYQWEQSQWRARRWVRLQIQCPPRIATMLATEMNNSLLPRRFKGSECFLIEGSEVNSDLHCSTNIYTLYIVDECMCVEFSTCRYQPICALVAISVKRRSHNI